MTSTGINLLTSQLRITGFATGLDTDQIISDLMKVERLPLDKLYQQKQVAEWKMDEYRNITKLLMEVKGEYFNVLKPDTYMLSQSTYKKNKADSTDISVVTAQAGTNAIPGIYEIEIIQTATSAKIDSTTGVTAMLKSKEVISSDNIEKAGGKTINVVLDGISKQITMNSYAEDTTLYDVALDLQNKIDKAFGSGKIIVESIEEDGGSKLSFDTLGGASKITLLKGSSNDGLQYLNISEGSSNRLDVNLSLENLSSMFSDELIFDGNGNLVFSINGKEFTFAKTSSLINMMNTISNDSTAGVIFTYDEASDKFKISARQTGAGETISISQMSGNFFGDDINAGASRISSTSPVVEYGSDAMVKINGELIIRSNNTFTINNIAYTLNKESSSVQKINVTADVDAVYNNIKSFVEKYNNMIDVINAKLNEEYDRNYKPLTDEQKMDMSDKEIELWEKKAKTGLLRNDSILENIVFSMRKALFDKISGLDLNLTSIGITTGTYQEKGKLKINDAKLKEAISNNPDKVMELFAKKSETYPSYERTMTAEERSVRYNESGLAYRLFDIIEDNISTFRNSNGQKGILLEKAGIEGDTTEYTNLIQNEIRNYKLKIDSLYERLVTKENNYFIKFAEMEQIIAKMNAQSNWLTMQFSNNY